MNPRMMDALDILTKSTASPYPIPKKPVKTLPELLEITNKIPLEEMESKKIDGIIRNVITNGHQEILKGLIDAKANLQMKSGSCSWLRLAAHSGNKEIVKTLIEAKVNVNECDDSGFTALQTAGITQKNEILQLLLDKNADPNIVPKHCFGALFFARKHPDTMKILLDGGATVTKKMVELDLLCSYVDTYGNLEKDITEKQLNEALSVVTLLLNKGAFVELPSSLYQFLRRCNQKNPDVLIAFTKFCEHEEQPLWAEERHAWHKKHAFQPAKQYLAKLKVVMQYPVVTNTELFSKNDNLIFLKRDIPKEICAKNIEDIYEKICKIKHPYWYMLKPLGVSVEVKPEDYKTNRI